MVYTSISAFWKSEPYTDTFTKCENETEIEMIYRLLKINTYYFNNAEGL